MRALIVVDVQNDFMPDGALPVPAAWDVIEPVNALMASFREQGSLVVATQDWHPRNHGSFASNNPGTRPGELHELAGLAQVMWPDHCVHGTPGAEFVPALRTELIDHIVQKGMDPTVDSYSGFFDNARRHDTGLTEWLQSRGVTEVVVCGVATDYCVKFTVLDALSQGFATTLVEDACRGVDLNPGDVESALGAMAEAGAVRCAWRAFA